MRAIRAGWITTQSGETIFIDRWDTGIFFPDCTFITISAEWAYKDQPALKSGKLVGAARREAREQALKFVCRLMNSKIGKIAIENPIGVIGSRIFWYIGGENGEPRWEVYPRKLDNGGRKPDQIIQPYQFGDDASKSTCLWLKNLPKLVGTSYCQPRIVDGKKRWSNQTDGGQNKLPPSENRAELRSKTYPGIAKSMAAQWSNSDPRPGQRTKGNEEAQRRNYSTAEGIQHIKRKGTTAAEGRKEQRGEVPQARHRPTELEYSVCRSHARAKIW